MSHPAARLVAGLVVFVVVGWLLGELWTSIVGSGELGAMREVAAQRSTALTDAARVVTWAGSAFVLVPLALIACLVLVRAGLRREALGVAVSSRVHTGVHYPSDIAAGAAIGIGSGVLATRLPRWVGQRRVERHQTEVVR